MLDKIGIQSVSLQTIFAGTEVVLLVRAPQVRSALADSVSSDITFTLSSLFTVCGWVLSHRPPHQRPPFLPIAGWPGIIESLINGSRFHRH